MEQPTGGGASRSTDPAAGSSAATDVSLREYFAMRLDAMDRHLTNEISSLRRESVAAVETAERAVDVAATEAKERLAAHNGLIEQMRQQAQFFATRESLDDFKQVVERRYDGIDKRFGRLERFQASVMGGLFLVSLIGIANFVKVWGG